MSKRSVRNASARESESRVAVALKGKYIMLVALSKSCPMTGELNKRCHTKHAIYLPEIIFRSRIEYKSREDIMWPLVGMLVSLYMRAPSCYLTAGCRNFTESGPSRAHELFLEKVSTCYCSSKLILAVLGSCAIPLREGIPSTSVGVNWRIRYL